MKHPSDKDGNPAGSVLIVDDEAIARRVLERALADSGWCVDTAPDGRRAIELLRRSTYDVVVTDLKMDDVDGLDVLHTAKQRDSETQVIIITGFASVDSAIESMRRGAFHYVQKPVQADELLNLVRRATEQRRLRCQVRELRRAHRRSALDALVGNSPAIAAIKRLVHRISDTDCNVLITGESGTGKELVAQAVHDTSDRDGRFVAVNCAAFSDELLENELFGHEKGAFTGAAGKRGGLLLAAAGGTIFFDEVGDMSPAMQAKLLRVLEEGEFMRVGGTEPIDVDLRVIAATNKDLERAIADKTFRQDLYFRLKVIEIHVPPLRERTGDIPLLAMHFLDRMKERFDRPSTGFSSAALGILQRYSYPGNVRELHNIVEQTTALSRSETIEVYESLEAGDRVQWVVRMRGRERYVSERWVKRLNTILDELQDRTSQPISIIRAPRSEGFRILAIVESAGA